MNSKDVAIDIRGETPFLAQIAWAIAWRRHMHHQQPVNNEQNHRNDRQCPRPGGQENNRREEVADGDALQHAGNANRREMKVREAGEKLAQQKDDNRAIDDLEQESLFAGAALDALTKR